VAITVVAADRMGVPVTMPAPVVDTRVRTEATDVKRDLILTNAALQLGRRFFLQRAFGCFLCIPRLTERSVYTARFSLRRIF
jgi:hypothetical protein